MRFCLLAIAVAACAGAPPPAMPTPPAPPSEPTAAAPAPARPADHPASRRDAVVDRLHGTDVADPYRWLEDASKPEVQAWMKAQDDYARAKLASLPGRDALARRLREVFYYDAVGAPLHRKGRLFFTRK